MIVIVCRNTHRTRIISLMLLNTHAQERQNKCLTSVPAILLLIDLLLHRNTHFLSPHKIES